LNAGIDENQNNTKFLHDADDDTLEIIAGLESFGRVKKLFGPVTLDTPSCSQDTTYAMFSNTVKISFESGAWPCERRSSDHSALKVYIFLPPNPNLLPGDSCGPAVYIKSKKNVLLKPIHILLPCDISMYNGTKKAVSMSHNIKTENWILDSSPAHTTIVNGTVWVTTQNLSVHLAVFLPAELSSVSFKAEGVIVGSVIGSAIVVFISSLLIWFTGLNINI
jgi:hypothetical protein